MQKLPTTDYPKPTEDWIAQAREHIDGRPVCVSVSGGKDSTATCLLLKEAGIPYVAVHMDTGWEHKVTEHYVREVLPAVVGPVQIIQSEVGGMAEWVRKKGMFPSRMRRFCTQELKIKPLIKFYEQFDDEPVSAVGIRAAESRARSQLDEWEDSPTLGCETWRPLIRWTYDEVIAIHKHHGVVPNPLYLNKGQNRVGCWPCIMSRKDEIRAVAETDPERIDLIRSLEAELLAGAQARADARGEPMKSRPVFFHGKLARRSDDPRRDVGIDEIVAWSQTKYGGAEFVEFDEDSLTSGCVRWGMCDQGADDAKLAPCQDRPDLVRNIRAREPRLQGVENVDEPVGRGRAINPCI